MKIIFLGQLETFSSGLIFYNASNTKKEIKVFPENILRKTNGA